MLAFRLIGDLEVDSLHGRCPGQLAAVGARLLDEPHRFELAEIIVDGGAILIRLLRELCARGRTVTANQVEQRQSQRVGERAQLARVSEHEIANIVQTSWINRHRHR
jgi:hypothetical protein